MVSSGLQAVPVSGLYETSVPVADQSLASRKEAAAAGLSRVLDRVTGTTAWREQITAEEVDANTQRLLEQFSYQQNPARLPAVADAQGTGEASGSTAGSASAVEKALPWLLKLKFSSTAVNRLLGSRGLAVWSANRPQVMLWIARDVSGRREVVAENTADLLVRDLQSAANHWGVPVLLPLMDLEDSANLNVSDLWGFFPDRVEAASGRYRSDAIAMAKVYQDSAGRWVGAWQLRINGQPLVQQELEAESREAWSEQLLSGMASQLAGKYAVTVDAGNSGRIMMDVSNIRSFRDYVDVSRVLQKLAPVQKVSLDFISREAVRYELTLSTSPEQLQEHLALQQILQPVVGAPDSSDVRLSLHYRWQSDQQR